MSPDATATARDHGPPRPRRGFLATLVERPYAPRWRLFASRATPHPGAPPGRNAPARDAATPPPTLGRDRSSAQGRKRVYYTRVLPRSCRDWGPHGAFRVLSGPPRTAAETASRCWKCSHFVAEEKGFEPLEPLPVRRFSKSTCPATPFLTNHRENRLETASRVVARQWRTVADTPPRNRTVSLTGQCRTMRETEPLQC